MRKSDLERRLEAVPELPAAAPEREAVRTPARIAADLLWHAQADGAMAGKRVLDLGCGTGMFAIGAALLDATVATGVDIDPAAIVLAQRTALAGGLADRTWFIVSDIADYHADPPGFDTVVMNPPFGAQAGNRHADRAFLAKAVASVVPKGSVWFLALRQTEPFLQAFARDARLRIERVDAWDYPLPARQAFHRDEVRIVRVGGYRLGA